MQLEKLFSEALGIQSPWKIVSLKFDSDKKRLDIQVDFQRGSTFEYQDPQTQQTASYKAYDTVQKTWRHLNFFEHECYIHARVPRIKPAYGGIKQVSPPWSGLASGFTLLFEALILQLCTNMPVLQVGKILNISNYRLWRVIDLYVHEALSEADYSDLKAVGMDETSIKKGHNYITLFVDLKDKKTIFVTEGKDHKTVSKFSQVIESQGGKRENIKDVSCDMSPAFIKGVKEELPEAEITFDKFHVIKIINEAVDEIRREEAKSNPILKGSRYALLKNKSKLSASQKEKIEDLSNLNLKSIRALHMRENFQEIYKSEDTESFEKWLKKWYYWATHSRLKPMIKAAKTIKKHWDGIVKWKESEITNGILEGLNSVVQAAKRKARGYKLEHFKTMAYLLTGKLNLNTINPFLPT